MDKSIVLPDGTFVKDVNQISMITPIEVKEIKVGGGWFRKPEVQNVYCFTVTIIPTIGKVEEIEFEYENEKEAEEDRNSLIKEIQSVLSNQNTLELETIENLIEIPSIGRKHSTELKLTAKKK